jgi:hypothetical protein
MRVWDTFAVSYGIAAFCLLLKWVSKYVASEQTRIWCVNLIGVYAEDAPFWRQFRALGFDLANAAVALLIVAYMVPESALVHTCGTLGCYERLFGITIFMIFVVLYILVAKLRYSVLEGAEMVYNTRKSWLFGMSNVIVGLIMLFGASSLAVGVE